MNSVLRRSRTIHTSRYSLDSRESLAASEPLSGSPKQLPPAFSRCCRLCSGDTHGRARRKSPGTKNNVSSSGHLERQRKVVRLPCFVLPQMIARASCLRNYYRSGWNHRGLRGTQRLWFQKPFVRRYENHLMAKHNKSIEPPGSLLCVPLCPLWFHPHLLVSGER